MELSIFFMITCVCTARFLEKKKMKAAAALYTVMFALIFTVLLFTLEHSFIQTALSNIFGEKLYGELHEFILEVVNMSFYGVSLMGVIGLTFAIQAAIAIFQAAKSVAECFIKKHCEAKFRKVYFKPAFLVRNPHLPRKINLLYCRMLN